MGNAPSDQALVNSINHPSGKVLVNKLIKKTNAQTIVAPMVVEVSIKSKKQKNQSIIQEIISCITAQNPKKETFGLFISERIITEEVCRIFCKAIANERVKLSTLSLVRCQFSETCFEIIGKSLEINKNLKSLNFSHSNLNASTEAFRLFIESLKINETLAELFLDNTQLDQQRIEYLSEILSYKKSLRIVDVASNNLHSNSIDLLIKASKQNAFVTNIRVKDNPGATIDRTQQLARIFLRNECVVHTLDVLVKSAFVQITLKRRVSQTMAATGGRARSEQSEMSRGRARGGTIDMSVVPTSFSMANSDEAEMEDCGNSPSARYQVGSAHTRGRRPDMQDASLLQGTFMGNQNDDLFCVFDGHGSQESAIFAAKQLPDILKQKVSSGTDEVTSLRETFLEVDNMMRPFAITQGTTAVVCLIRDDTLYVANVGDSRAVLCRNGKAIRLTVDHKPDLPGETKRIERLGGEVRNNRVRGVLAVSRALGDHFADDLVSAEPHITVTRLNKQDEFLLIACDGLFDIFMDDVAVAIASGFTDPQLAATKLKDQAFLSGSTDNISVVIVKFGNNHQAEPSPADEPVVHRGLWVSSSDESEDSEGEEDQDDHEGDDENEEGEEQDSDLEQEQSDHDDDDNDDNGDAHIPSTTPIPALPSDNPDLSTTNTTTTTTTTDKQEPSSASLGDTPAQPAELELQS